MAATLLMLLLAAVAMPSKGSADEGGGAFVRQGLPALAVAGALGFAVAVAARTGPDVSPAWGVLWVVPAAMALRGMGRTGRLSYARWFCAFWLAATCAAPFAWSARTGARMEIAEGRMGRLGTPAEPELEGLLQRFADEVEELDRAGAGPVEMLYHGWVSSGLAAHGAPVFVTLWSADGTPRQELRLGAEGELPPVVAALVPEVSARGVGTRLVLDDLEVRHLAAVPLPDGRVVTAALPPRRTIPAPTGQGPLLGPVLEAGSQEFLTLVRAPDAAGATADSVAWARNAEGWMGRGLVRFPDGPYVVSYTISIPNLAVMLARAVLLFVAGLAAATLVWLCALWIRGFRFPVPIDLRELFTSFRARVTWTLFGFFVLSNVVFGTLAYGALSGASERTATALAERVVGQIAAAYREEGGSMESLARRVGADLLEYRGGELVGGSVDELIELGLYETWGGPRHLPGVGDRRAAGGVQDCAAWGVAVCAGPPSAAGRGHRGFAGAASGGGGGAPPAGRGRPAGPWRSCWGRSCRSGLP